MSPLDAGAVDEDADLVVVGEDLGCESADLFGFGNVGGVDPGFAPEFFDGFFGFGDAGVSLFTVSRFFCM